MHFLFKQNQWHREPRARRRSARVRAPETIRGLPFGSVQAHLRGCIIDVSVRLGHLAAIDLFVWLGNLAAIDLSVRVGHLAAFPHTHAHRRHHGARRSAEKGGELALPPFLCLRRFTLDQLGDVGRNLLRAQQAVSDAATRFACGM